MTTLRAACEQLLFNYDLTGHDEPVQELAKDIEAIRAALAEDGVRRHMEAEARLGSWPDAVKTPAYAPRPAPASDKASDDMLWGHSLGGETIVDPHKPRPAPAEAAEPVAWAMDGELGGLTLFCDRPTLIEKSIGRAAIPLYRRPPASAPAREENHFRQIVGECVSQLLEAGISPVQMPLSRHILELVAERDDLKAQLDRLRAGKETT